MVLAVVLLFLTVTTSGVLIAWQLHDRATTDWQREASDAAERTAAEMVANVTRSVARVGGAAGLVTAEGTVPTGQFVAFAETLAVDPAVVGTALNLIVPRAERAAFEAEHGFEIVDRDATGAMQRAPDRPVYVPVATVTPLEARTAQLLGYDHLRDPERAPVLQRALASPDAVVSDPVTLVSGRDGFFVARALHTGAGDPVGFVVVAFDAEQLVDEVARRTNVTVTAVDLGGQALHRVPGAAVGPTARAVTQDANRTWSVEVLAEERPSIAVPAAVIVVFVLVASGLTLVFSLVRRHEDELGRVAAELREQYARTDAHRRLAERLAAATEPAEVAVAATTAARLIGADWLRVTIDGDPRRPLAMAGDDGVPPHDAETLPLRTGGGDHGTIVVSPPTSALDDARQTVRQLATDLVASAAARTKRRASERELASSLQQMLLPRLPEHFPLGAARGVYRPVATSQVGGDWYDAISDEAIGTFVIGDVVGKGIRAAGAMGNLRIATRMVDDLREPHAVLAELDEVACAVPDTFLTTMAVVVADRVRREIRLASAGHLPPLVVSGGETELMVGGLGPPLGIRPPGGRVPARRAWDGPVRIVLYTDGLVERRHQSVTDNTERLRRSVQSHARRSLPEFCELVLDDMRAIGPEEDDIALLAIDLPAHDATDGGPTALDV